VTTRAVAEAAGVQAPTIYRLFGDENGLLDAVAEHGFASTWRTSARPARGGDPVASLRDGWELHTRSPRRDGCG
jgi:AcrR family transcriptional regulator